MNPMPLSLSTFLSRASVRPAGSASEQRLSVAFEVEAHGEESERPSVRRPSRTVLAVDISGSMAGEPLDQVIRSIDRLVDALGAEDELGIVAFSDDATSLIEPLRVDAAGKRLVRSRVAKLRATANTNIEAGLDASAKMLETTPSGMRRGVVLLSDGAPNRGAHTEAALRDVVKRHRPSLSCFALGYGINHCEDILAAIGDAGGAGYEYVQDPAMCARAFARALGAQADVVASAIELVVGVADGVELLRFEGREPTRIAREGVIVSLPDMVPGARTLIALELKVTPPSADRFLTRLFDVTLRWRGVRGEPLACSESVTIEVADRDGALGPAAARRVLVVRADRAREAARAAADRGQFTTAAAGLRAVMKEIEALPGWGSGTDDRDDLLREAYELLADEVMAFDRKPSAEQYSAFRKATVQSRLTAQVPKSARLRGEASSKLIEEIAGDCRPAWLVVIRSGVEAGRHRLREEAVIGRTSEADICVSSHSVSRKHAEIFANLGDYWVADLGSTNATLVNGQALGQAPHKLRVGDVIRVGEVELRYEE